MKKIASLFKNKSLNWTNKFLFSNNITKQKPKLQAELPKDEENLDILLKEMNKNNITTENLNNLITQKDDILFVSNDIDTLRHSKLGQFFLINNKYLTQCVSVKEKLTTMLLFDKVK
jgi:hypothetical protein